MPMYILKRYHRVVPTNQKVWHLGREIAFEAETIDGAIALAKDRHLADFQHFGGFALLLDQEHNRIWESHLDAQSDN